MNPTQPVNDAEPGPGSWVLVAIAWTLVGIPLAWGIYRTLRTALALFR
ncbi:MAG TPA: hypothetical protein VK132_05555 [Gemmatimonadales bacterium]|nr:hypothetical protein [Gemmatimonadales bacterium]